MAPACATFADVPPTHAAFGEVEAGVDAGWWTGCGGDRFCPGAPLTRAAMAVVIDRVLAPRSVAPTTQYADVPATHWAAGAVARLTAAGVIEGCGDDRFCPDAALTRAELAALLASIDAEPSLRGQVAVILTADHGGGVPFISHTVAMAPENFVIPFLVWLGEDRAPAELAALNADRRAVAPATKYLGDDASPAPIRNAEAGNLALQLLGMPAIPGSVANARQDLLLQEPAR